MTRNGSAVLALLMIACGPSNQPAAHAGSPSPLGSVATTPVAASPSAAPNASLPVTGVNFSCRLPVTIQAGAGDGITLQGGFVTFPAASLAMDTAGTMNSRYPEDGFVTTASPALVGSGGYGFFDRGQSRWVPVPPSQASADGRAYAYVSTDWKTNLSKLFVVTVTSGQSRSFDVPTPQSPFVMDYGTAGVYLSAGSAMGGPALGVWLVDPATGNIKALRTADWVWAVRDGYAWVGRFDSRDQTVWPPMEIARLNSLIRIDLATGAETTWFYAPGRYPWMIGLASGGRPLVVLGGPNGNELRLLNEPGLPGQVIHTGNDITFDTPQADGDRIWFGGATGIYLYTPAAGLQRVFAYNADPTTAPYIHPAGFCE